MSLRLLAWGMTLWPLESQAAGSGVVARVHKTMYVRLKRRFRPVGADPGEGD